jgi:hypothetical protein
VVALRSTNVNALWSKKLFRWYTTCAGTVPGTPYHVTVYLHGNVRVELAMQDPGFRLSSMCRFSDPPLCSEAFLYRYYEYVAVLQRTKKYSAAKTLLGLEGHVFAET